MKTKLIKISLIILVLLGLVTLTAVKGATIFEDDFETYDLGSINSQGNWISPYNRWRVVDTEAKQGIKSANYSGYLLGEVYKDGNYIIEGSIDYSIKIKTAPREDADITLWLLSMVENEMRAGIYCKFDYDYGNNWWYFFAVVIKQANIIK